MKTFIFSLILLAIGASAHNIIKTEKLETKYNTEIVWIKKALVEIKDYMKKDKCNEF